MKARQKPHGTTDRISTREELHQVLDVLLTARDLHVTADEFTATLSVNDVESRELAAVLSDDAEEESTGLLEDMVPLAELFPADHARVVN